MRRKHLRKDHPRPCRPWRTARIFTQRESPGHHGLASTNGQRRYPSGNGSRTLARKLRSTGDKRGEHHRDTHKVGHSESQAIEPYLPPIKAPHRHLVTRDVELFPLKVHG